MCVVQENNNFVRRVFLGSFPAAYFFSVKVLMVATAAYSTLWCVNFASISIAEWKVSRVVCMNARSIQTSACRPGHHPVACSDEHHPLLVRCEECGSVEGESAIIGPGGPGVGAVSEPPTVK